jgi:hypothetical protein
MLTFLKMAPFIVRKFSFLILLKIKRKPTRLIPIAEHDFCTIGFIVIDNCCLSVRFDVLEEELACCGVVIDFIIGVDDKITVAARGLDN